jgi:hypothetical protein
MIIIAIITIITIYHSSPIIIITIIIIIITTIPWNPKELQGAKIITRPEEMINYASL